MSKPCNHILGLTDQCWEGYSYVESDDHDKEMFEDQGDERFNFCPRCGVKLDAAQGTFPTP